MKRQMLPLLALLGAVLPATAAADEEALTVRVQRLNLDTATRIARAALEACREQGIQVGVSVLDRNGIPQVVLRDTLAPPVTLPISRGKAYAAVMFGVPTSELDARANTPIGRVPGLVMSPGAVPVQAGGALLGAVGVSGAPSGATDEACARAGVEAVQDDLEMAD
ncbi:MAG TPA: heme-binding protein [Gammaproteobacteria bacterium]|nr:heme-binding protein [Gammaproteobacteria bacterium]